MLAKNLFLKLFVLIVVLSQLCSCSTYPSQFKCGDAKGFGCLMLREIDIKIDSGEIELPYVKATNNKKCKNCISNIISTSTGYLEEDINDNVEFDRKRKVQ